MKFHKDNKYVQSVVLNVSNLNKSKQFYTDVVGLSVIEEFENSIKLGVDDRVLLTLIQPEIITSKSRNSTGLYHFAILLSNKIDLANLVIRLSDNHIKVGAADHLVSEAIYFDDPDGNGIEVYVDRDSDEWTWQKELVAMDNQPFDFNGLLTYYDENSPKVKLDNDAIMGHIHLHVNDLEAAKAYYVDGLGFDVVSKLGEHALFISSGKYHHHIGLNTWLGPFASRPLKNSPGLNYFTIIYPNSEELETTINRLKNLAYPVEEFDTYYLTEDPVGNSIRLQLK